MAFVGGVSVSLLHGHAPRMSEVVETWRQPGVDGIGAHLQGLGGGDFEYRAVFFGSPSFVDGKFQSLEDLKGTIITVIDDFGVTHEDLLVKDTGPRIKKAILGNGGCRGEMQIMGMQTEDTAPTQP